ncbi:hypothetical protein E0H56_15115 [Rhizobium leguminosarum bv. viciae]|jgi:hypothetical protein|uniref:Uncharacterized protein n=1 Tax=Rhizobium leguminosarum bv. trifolii TaxID=386 RepID=A0A1C9I473_RHILT|nr:hypothetical protein [Rhizobium leguminosarum]AOO93778.1 hypothetical protein [Rhizobium leguminosarum bv. trifolii]TBZ93292.1 hypothetical protein E0H56_15115 [Rhizobium leguminosarum bv. viciae]
MASELDRLERILGGKFERRNARAIPGTQSVDGVEIVYFSDDGKNNFRKQFRSLTSSVDPRAATRGGMNERGCRITPPNGPLFHAIGYHGDVDGWRKDVQTGAKARGLLLARIEDGDFIVSDGRRFALSECQVEFC